MKDAHPLHDLGVKLSSAIQGRNPNLEGATALQLDSRMSETPHLSLVELDALLADAERQLKLARECHFGDLVALMEVDIRMEILTSLYLLAALADGADRRAVEARIKRVRRMLQ